MTVNLTEGTAFCRVRAGDLSRVTAAVLQGAGLSPEHASQVTDALVDAELRGQGSHGVSRLLDIYVSRLMRKATNPRPVIRIVAEKGGTAVVDGDNGPGQVVGRYAMELAVKLSREHGLGAVAVRGSNHYGAAAYYLKDAVRHGVIGFTTTNAPPNMPPWGGKRPYLGTNPFAVAVPAGKYGAILLDMATSVVDKGKIQLMAKEGQKTIPFGWALDAEGRDTQEVGAVLNGGMMLPVGGPKGYGLALVVEILSAMLSGADFGPHLGNMYTDFTRPQNAGHFFAALDISGFVPPVAFYSRMERLADELRAVPRREDCPEILMPGEIESRCEARYRVQGIPIEPAVLAEITRIAVSFGVEPPAPLASTSAADGPDLNVHSDTSREENA
jgi:LDH2 family malate/lactate/ureidoglycolate dehydrogenase